MANKYLISAMVNDVETFYTASPNGSITSIGDRIDWSKGFDDYTLSCIDNSVYSTLKNGKVWVNSNAVMASEETTGESYVYTTDQTAIDCSGYSGLSSLVFNFNGTISENQKTLIKAAISFNGRKAYYTRGNGYIAANTTAIPTTAAGRTTAGINIDENNFAVLFDGDLNNTMFSTKDSSVIVPVEFTNGLVARKYDITIPPSCRLPLISTFQVYDSETSSWKTLDTIIIKASKTISRYFDNEINGTTYRWVFNADPTDLGDDPTRSIDITELNVYGRTTGTVWLLLDNPEEVKTRGLSLAELEALTSADFNQIFDQTQIDFVIYVPKKFNDGVSLSGITANFPANGAPMIDYFRAITNKIHAGDVDVIFKIIDPENEKVKYRLYVNDQLVITKYNVTSNTDIRETIPNSAFKKIDITSTKVVEATNIIKLEAEDEYGAMSSETYTIIKIDNLPTLVGVLDEDTYEFNFTISDTDSDKVKYAAYINDVDTPIGTSTFMKVPTNELTVTIPQNHIKINQDNILKLVLTDSVFGETTVLIKFKGTYPSLLFYDEAGDLLSTNFGEVLKKLDLGVICCGQTSIPVKVVINNNTSKAVKDLVIRSPRDIDGVDEPIKDSNGALLGTQHKNGDTWIQLSLEDSFSNPSTYYDISIDNLSAHESKEFWVRAYSARALADPNIYQDIEIKATSTIVNKVVTSQLNTMRR